VCSFCHTVSGVQASKENKTRLAATVVEINKTKTNSSAPPHNTTTFDLVFQPTKRSASAQNDSKEEADEDGDEDENDEDDDDDDNGDDSGDKKDSDEKDSSKNDEDEDENADNERTGRVETMPMAQSLLKNSRSEDEVILIKPSEEELARIQKATNKILENSFFQAVYDLLDDKIRGTWHRYLYWILLGGGDGARVLLTSLYDSRRRVCVFVVCASVSNVRVV
jgi:hypothetical protein